MAYYDISFYGATANYTNLNKIILQQKTILRSPVCLYANPIDFSTTPIDFVELLVRVLISRTLVGGV